MAIINTGTLQSNIPFTQEVAELINKTLSFGSYQSSEVKAGEREIEFNEYYDRDFELTMKDLCSNLTPLGVVLNGQVDYYGDDEGTTYVEDNRAEQLNSKERDIVNAEDEELIKVLQDRGYTVLNEADAREAKISRLTNLLNNAVKELCEGADEDYQGNLADILGMTTEEAELFGLPVREDTPIGNSPLTQTTRRYAVVSAYVEEYDLDTNGETQVWLCDTEDEAKKLCKKFFELSRNMAQQDDNYNEDDTVYDECTDVGIVAWVDGSKRYFEVIEITENKEALT